MKYHVKQRITAEQQADVSGHSSVHLIAPDNRVLALIPVRDGETMSEAKERAAVIAEMLNLADANERRGI